MPFGKHRGVRLRLLPDDYLSWLTSIDLSRFGWLRESLLAELRHRGLRADLVEDEYVCDHQHCDIEECPCECHRPAPAVQEPLPLEPAKRPTRVYRL